MTSSPGSPGNPPTGLAGATAAVAQVRDLLRGGLVAATLTPFRPDGTVARSAVAPYAAALVDAGARGLAVGAHTGRGVHLPADDLTFLVRECGQATGAPVVAGLSLPAGTGSPDDLVALGARLRDAGARALLVSPVPYADRAATVGLHVRLGEEVGLPLVAFVLYERASRLQYDVGTLTELLALPWVCGVKLALLDDAMACQDLLEAATAAAPEALVFTGEDRMYGPSLMWGAQAALLGIAAALPAWSAAVLDSWTRGDLPEFVRASARLDALARLTFREPMEGYVQRMAWVAAWQGLLPADVAFDPYAPPLPAGERATLLERLDALAG
ncbi:dihydrodipicolinate synthase family protein [Actinopolymorpha singaporensis]